MARNLLEDFWVNKNGAENGATSAPPQAGEELPLLPTPSPECPPKKEHWLCPYTSVRWEQKHVNLHCWALAQITPLLADAEGCIACNLRGDTAIAGANCDAHRRTPTETKTFAYPWSPPILP